ncbi:agamous-like MADS-box protein AGL28 [Capsicum annuum]|uniref:agamous-like MADS-box protein AGL28 n=1 Tax=Capsicum annuum TaxID=4072 RepID=UPI001FB183EB|nr:agamous-like MADS-box protein AGL28 [Capsicum annuum]
MERKKTAGRRKIPLVKIEKHVDQYSTFSKRCSDLYKEGSELVRENDVDLGIVLTSPTDKTYAFVHPTSNAAIDRFMNLKTDFGDQIIVENSRNKTRDKNRWESIDQLNANEIMKFQAWLDVGEFMLKDQLPEASSSSQSPPEDANI